MMWFKLDLRSVLALIGMSVAPATAQTAAYISYSGSISVVDVASGNILNTIAIGGSFLARLAFSPDGSRLYAANGPDTIVVIDTTTNTVTSRLDAGYFLALSPDGQKLYAI